MEENHNENWIYEFDDNDDGEYEIEQDEDDLYFSDSQSDRIIDLTIYTNLDNIIMVIYAYLICFLASLTINIWKISPIENSIINFIIWLSIIVLFIGIANQFIRAIILFKELELIK